MRADGRSAGPCSKCLRLLDPQSSSTHMAAAGQNLLFPRVMDSEILNCSFILLKMGFTTHSLKNMDF